MILPTNGKVAIFDDKYDDVKNLLGSLSKQKIPYFYFQDEGGEDLPETPINNIRLIFLDIELVTDNKSTDQTIISYIGGRLAKVLKPNSNYVLIYWSTKLEKYKDLINNAFDHILKDYKPILNISLNKIDALKSPDPVGFIVQEIRSKAEDFKVLKVFSFWENLVNDSSGDLINGFTDFIEKDNSWDDTAKHILYKLAYAYAGKQITELNELDQLKNAYYTLNHTFIDSMENVISISLEDQKTEFSSVISSSGVDTFTSIINKKLLVSEELFSGNIPGTIFFIDDERGDLESKLDKELENKKLNSKIPENKKNEIIAKAEAKVNDRKKEIAFSHSLIEKNYKYMLNALLSEDNREKLKTIFSDSIKIELNISPICDYAQNKMPCCRLLPGFLITENNIEFLLKSNAFNYISDAKIDIKGVKYFFIFDFRLLHSSAESMTKKRISNFKLRQQLLADIQLKLGSHINRAGVLYL